MNTRTTLLVLVIVLIIATFFRLHQLTELPPGLYPDEAMNGNNAVEALVTGEYRAFYPENNGREGLFVNIQAFFLGLFGVHEPWVLRLPSALFGILTVLGMYVLGKELFGDRRYGIAIGLLSAFFLATSFWHINFSRIGFRAIMAPACLVWASYFFLMALRKGKISLSLAYALLSGLSLGAGMHSYIAYRVMPLLFAAFIPFFFRDKRFWTALGVTAVVSVLVSLPLFLHFAANPQDFLGRTSQVSVFNSPAPLKDLGINVAKTVGMFFFVGDWNWRHNLAGRPELFWPVAMLFLVGIGLGIKSIFSGLPKRMKITTSDVPRTSDVATSSWILFGWLGLATLPVVISNEGMPHALRAILMIPPAMLLAAWGGVWVYRSILKKNLVPKRFLKVGVAVLFLLIVLDTSHAYFIEWGKSPHTPGAFTANYVELGQEMNALPQETPKYVVVEAGGVDVRGIPMPAQTVMFITDTFLLDRRAEKNVHYVLPHEIDRIPEGAEMFYVR